MQNEVDLDLAGPYEYHAFQHTDEIRVLVLAPTTESEEICCSLKHVRLSDKPDFEALSYAWGDSAKPRRVFCDKKIINVTENLYIALRNLRYKDRERAIWADAICINQDDDLLGEKSQQVGLMGKIYSEAQCTVVWLGEDPDGRGKLAFDFVMDFVSQIPVYSSRQGESVNRRDFIRVAGISEEHFSEWIGENLVKRVFGLS